MKYKYEVLLQIETSILLRIEMVSIISCEDQELLWRNYIDWLVLLYINPFESWQEITCLNKWLSYNWQEKIKICRFQFDNNVIIFIGGFTHSQDSKGL